MTTITKKQIANSILKLLDKTEILMFIDARPIILLERHPDGNTELAAKRLAKLCNNNEVLMDKFRSAYTELSNLFFVDTQHCKHSVNSTVTGEKSVLFHLCDDLKLQLKLIGNEPKISI